MNKETDAERMVNNWDTSESDVTVIGVAVLELIKPSNGNKF